MTSKLERDPICKILKKGTEENNYVVLRGYLGESEKDGFSRLYSDAALTDFIDIEDTEVHHLEKVELVGTNLQQSLLWVSESTEVEARGKTTVGKRAASFNSPGDFLGGKISDSALSAASLRPLLSFLGGDGEPPVTGGSACGTCSELCSLGCPDNSGQFSDPLPIIKILAALNRTRASRF